MSAAEDGGWSVRPNPRIAFFQVPVHQRLYLEPKIKLDQYVALWEGSGWERIGGYRQDQLRESLWPWLKEHGCAKAEDDAVFGESSGGSWATVGGPTSVLGSERNACGHVRRS